ncbi:GGDEF domain-containing protein [Paenibacillus dendritiformis]|uniref:GGDEF domain-containing protein n=1 Tax=Paenibacillus dendritiformis TaxID=130049 RepID=UPI001BCB10BA|nr:GGDEF domain-containing protein [Paenibacillus dendritiformis]
MKYTGRIMVTAMTLCGWVVLIAYLMSAKMMNPMLAVLTMLMLGVAWRCGKRYDVVKYESEIDPLTLAYNRRSADVIFQRLAGKHRKNGQKTAVFFFDVDRFKEINDKYGHNAGDRVLRLISTVLLNSCGSETALVRWGGDEFVFLVPCSDRRDLRGIRSRIMSKLALAAQQAAVPFAVSYGYAVYPEEGTLLSDIVEMADRHMMRIKRSKLRCGSQDTAKMQL